MTSWSAFATITRSTASSSSALRRRVVVRSATSTMRASEPVLARDVADDADPVADHDALAAQRPRLHGRDRRVADDHAVPSPVDGEHDAVVRVVVRRPLLGPRPGASPGPLVVLLVLLAVATLARTS